MFKQILQGSDEKIQGKIEQHYAKGLQLLKGKFFNRAMIEFQNAMELDPKAIYLRLKEEFDKVSKEGSLEAALAIGLNLLKERHSDYELANKMGNFARKIKDYNQAETHYRAALKVKKDFTPAFYNLAATLAKVDLFDNDVKLSIKMFEKMDHFILPDYQGNEEVIQHFMESLEEKAELFRDKKIESLSIKQQEEEEVGEINAVEKLKEQIKKLRDSSISASPQDVVNEFQQLIESDPERKEIHLFNMGLYALSTNANKEALEAFSQLNSSQSENLVMLQAIGEIQNGKLDEGIKKMSDILGKNEHHRYCNVNIGLAYRRAKKKFLSIKFLVKAAALVQKSDGLYSINKLVIKADEAFQNSDYKKAYRYYTIATTEINTAEIWEKLGATNMAKKGYDEAVRAYNQALSIDPKSETAKKKIKKIHDYYINMGASLLDARKFKPSVEYYNRALRIMRLPEIIKQTAEIYRELQQPEESKKLMDEYQTLIDAATAQKAATEWQNIVDEGKKYFKAKHYSKAADSWEHAFRTKPDKDLFLKLASLYKGMKKHLEFQTLIAKWNKHVEREEKLEKLKQEAERRENKAKLDAEKQEKAENKTDPDSDKDRT